MPSSALALDGLAVLAERATLEGLTAGGRVSCGGATRLLRCADGWLAVSLARESDEDLVPAWLALAGATLPDGSALGSDRPAALWERRTEVAGGAHGSALGSDRSRALSERRTWEAVAEGVARVRGEPLVEAADVLGFPVGLVGEREPDASGGVAVTAFGPTARRARVRVVDLSALWAGPLCGALLAEAGAEVMKVESTTRPDAGRVGSPALHERLNGAKAERVVDLDAPGGRDELAALIRAADVVIESARPRALEQLGIVAAEELARPDGPQVWVSITGHGRSSNRVAFGDDAAVAGGLVVTTDDGPWFCGDAIADPLSGLTAAAAALELLAAGKRGLVDVAMAGVAAAHAGPTGLA